MQQSPQISKIFSKGYDFPDGNVHDVCLSDQPGQKTMLYVKMFSCVINIEGMYT